MAYTDPEVAWVGLTEAEAKAQGIKVGVGKFPGPLPAAPSPMVATRGFTKLIFDEDSHRIVGGGIVGTHAGDMISEVALAIEMGCDPADIGLTIHPHPTLGESVGMAAEVFEGVCTDLPPMRKKKKHLAFPPVLNDGWTRFLNSPIRVGPNFCMVYMAHSKS